MCDRFKRINFLSLFVLIAGILPLSFVNAQENPEVKAIQLFNSGNFSEAEKIFKMLLEQNSESPISNYYYGASRTENGHYGKKEMEYLKKAGENITPDRLHYYLAIQHHARGNWDQALKYYNQFRLSVPEMEQEELKLSKKIQLCYNQVNPFDTTSVTSVPQNVQTDSLKRSANTKQKELYTSPALKEEPTPLTASNNELNLIENIDNQESLNTDALIYLREALPDLPGVEPTIPDGDPVKFHVNNTITYLYSSQFQTEEGKNLFEKAMKLQQQQEKNLAEAEKLRTLYKNSQLPEERETLATKIITIENESLHIEEEIKNIHSELRKVENEYWENAGTVERKNFIMKQEKILSALNKDDISPRVPQEEILIDFIEQKAKSPAKTSPPELTYKIQIGAYSKGVPAYRQKVFKKLSIIRNINNYTDENGIVVYTTGNLTRYEDALKLQNQVRQEGIQDAKVVPYYNGKRITLEKAKQMEANNDI